MKALLVDDHTLFRSGLMMLLSARFPEVEMREAGGVREALERLQAEPDIELVLLDLGVSDSQGLSTLRQLRAVSDELTIVVMSATDDAETMIAALNEGIEALAKAHGLPYLDITDDFTNPNGRLDASLTVDGLHLNPAGYEIWHDNIYEQVKS